MIRTTTCAVPSTMRARIFMLAAIRCSSLPIRSAAAAADRDLDLPAGDVGLAARLDHRLDDRALPGLEASVDVPLGAVGQLEVRQQRERVLLDQQRDRLG